MVHPILDPTASNTHPVTNNTNPTFATAHTSLPTNNGGAADNRAIPEGGFDRHYPSGLQRARLRGMFGDPFPMALMGLLMASMPLACALMGWRGAGGEGAALVVRSGVFFFFGGMLQIIGAVMEWIVGNTFPFVVFASYGAFYLALGATFTPHYNAHGAYTDRGAYTDGRVGTSSRAARHGDFRSTYAFFFLALTILTLFYLIASLRTNIVLVIMFFFVDMAFLMMTSAYWIGGVAVSGRLQTAAGAFLFIFCLFGWYLFLSLILRALDFPWTLPLGDMSDKFPSAAGRKEKEGYAEKRAPAQQWKEKDY
ncbi:hypothetical protein LTR37_002557 [Vermiconidia calcicola]|uniref:Uncharacterized protein n=1 Tax=Vermiconidia calcicola TaxID=1690605 RepID=A0ACC3NS04_9PEZI|nr:hypothetical protein LTR37_002557 [Vermiconidia calcicola]